MLVVSDPTMAKKARPDTAATRMTLKARGGIVPAGVRLWERDALAAALRTDQACMFYADFPRRSAHELEVPLPRGSARVSRECWRWFNYCRWRALIATRDAPSPLRPRDTYWISFWYRRAMRIRDAIIECNIGLPRRMLSRLRPANQSHTADALSEANIGLLRAVDYFDVGLGWAFSSFACQCVAKAISGYGRKEAEHQLDALQNADGGESPPPVDWDAHRAAVNDLEGLFDIAGLTNAELAVIRASYGISTDDRIRQMSQATRRRRKALEQRAMEKLREAAGVD